MKNLMPSWLWFVAFAGTVFANSANTSSQFEIKKYRFNSHPKKGFERLVLEFKYGPSGTPDVKVVPNGKGFSVEVSKADLVGAIPEAAINDSFQNQSKILDNVSVEAEQSGSFTVHTHMKKSGAQLEAFWLANPNRLVIDAKGGHAVAHKRKPEVEEESSDREVAAEPETTVIGHKKWRKIKTEMFDKLWDVSCFHMGSAVNPAVSFGPKHGKYMEEIPPYPKAPAVEDPDSVICFPRSSELTPLVIFRSHDDDVKPLSKEAGKSEHTAAATPAAGAAVAAKPATPGAALPAQPEVKREISSLTPSATPTSPTAPVNLSPKTAVPGTAPADAKSAIPAPGAVATPAPAVSVAPRLPPAPAPQAPAKPDPGVPKPTKEPKPKANLPPLF